MRFFYNLLGGKHGVRWLAARYPFTGDRPADALTRQVVRIGKVRSRFCTTVGIGDSGLYLSVEPPGHRVPGIRIPWSEIQAVRPAVPYGRRASELVCCDPNAPPIAMDWRHVASVREEVGKCRTVPVFPPSWSTS
jgi:hypothetical protein